MKFAHKNEAALVFDENKRRLRLEGRFVLDRIMNEVLAEMTREFNDALTNGELLSLDGNAEARAFFVSSAQAQLQARLVEPRA